MGDLSVQRWRRFGHDRWYVNGADGTSLGWLDANTGELHLDHETHRAEVEAALAAHSEAVTPRPVTALPPPAPSPPEPSPPPAPATTPAEPWAVRVTHRDLGGREAGAEVAKQAAALREQAPVWTFLSRATGRVTEERAWRVGADGERKVARQLKKLPEGWRVLHSIPVGDRGADIDHLVIGPAGLFTINAKHHPDANVWVAGNTFMVNGRKVPYVRNARHEARRASRLLSAAVGRRVEVRGVIAVVGAAKGFTVKEQPTDVTVVARKRVARWLQDQRPYLPPGHVEDVHRVARRSDTWVP